MYLPFYVDDHSSPHGLPIRSYGRSLWRIVRLIRGVSELLVVKISISDLVDGGGWNTQ